ncbi:MAG: hypothetical protein RL398_2469, partial [Planctomycetota bacterium]
DRVEVDLDTTQARRLPQEAGR